MGQQDDFFADFGDEDFEEQPSFDLPEEDLLPDLDEDTERGGISRTFKIAGALILLSVVIIVILIIVFALGGDDLTDGQKTGTAVAEYNETVEAQYEQTLTAIAVAETATANAIATFDVQSTQTQVAFEEQQAQTATAAALKATDDFIASQTAQALASQQTATQQALDDSLTQTAAFIYTLRGRVVDKEGTKFGNATIRLYRDDGDEEFNPADLATPAPSAQGGGELGGTEGAQSINYGDIVQGSVGIDEADLYFFTGTAGDSVLIAATASDPVQMDLFLELFGPDANFLIGNDDLEDGSDSNPAISFILPADGSYTIRVTSVAGPGDYTLSLGLGLTVPSAPAPSADDGTERPTDSTDGEETGGEGAGSGETTGFRTGGDTFGGVLARPALQGTPAPGDELIETTITDPEGEFDFGALDPGVYWLLLDYDSLPDNLKALVDPGQLYYVKATVPTGGDPITFEIGSVVAVTATPRPTNTPTVEGTPGLVTATPSVEPGASALPTTGFFSDIGDDAGSLGGSSGLAVLAIAAAGLIAVVFIARKLRTSN